MRESSMDADICCAVSISDWSHLSSLLSFIRLSAFIHLSASAIHISSSHVYHLDRIGRTDLICEDRGVKPQTHVAG